MEAYINLNIHSYDPIPKYTIKMANRTEILETREGTLSDYKSKNEEERDKELAKLASSIIIDWNDSLSRDPKVSKVWIMIWYPYHNNFWRNFRNNKLFPYNQMRMSQNLRPKGGKKKLELIEKSDDQTIVLLDI